MRASAVNPQCCVAIPTQHAKPIRIATLTKPEENPVSSESHLSSVFSPSTVDVIEAEEIEFFLAATHAEGRITAVDGKCPVAVRSTPLFLPTCISFSLWHP